MRNWNHSKLLIVGAGVAAVCFGSSSAQAGRTVLLIVKDDASPNAEDLARKSLFESWGYDVVVFDVDSSQAEFDTAVTTADLAYIPEDIASGELNTKLKDAAIGVVCEEANLFDDFGISTGLSWLGSGAQINIVDNAHYLTSDFPVGNLTYLDTPQSIVALTSPFATGARDLANNGTGSSLLAVESGSALVGGGVAAGRRVQLPWGPNDFLLSYLNPSGEALLRRSLEWADGLVGHWTLDESAGTSVADSVAGHNGTSTSSTWVTGRVGGALELNGSQYVQIADNSRFRLRDALSVAGWVKGDSWGSGVDVDIILRKGEGNPNNWQLAIENGQVSLILDQNDTSGVKGSTVLSTGEWHHVAATWDGSEVRIYVDGVLDGGPVARAAPIGSDTRPVYLGGRSGTDTLDGAIDDVRLYNRAITAAEVAALADVAGTAGELLMVVIDPLSLTAAEAARRSSFLTWGYNVTLIADTDTQGAFDTAVASSDLVYVPSSVWDVSLGSKLNNAPVGVVVEPGWAFDLFGLTTSDVSTSGGTSLTVPAYDHHITSTLTPGSVAFTASSQPLNKVGESLPPGGQTLMTWWDGDAALVAIDAGARVVSGRSPGRRVFLPVGSSMDWSALSPEGQTVLRRALEWSGALRAYFPMDDESGVIATETTNRYDATLISMDPATSWTSGRVDGGLDFDGISNRAATATALTPPQVGTVAFWMRVPGVPANHGRIFGIHDTWEVRHAPLANSYGVADGALVFDLAWTGPNAEFATTVPLDEAGRWYHVAASYSTEEDTYEVYLDGVLNKSGAATLDLTASDVLSIGTRTGSSNYFEGTIDDLRIYSVRLGADEIAALAAEKSKSRVVRWSEVGPFP